MNLDVATEVFVRGFAFTRSFTHPYVSERVEQDVWALRDGPRKRPDYHRTEEYVAVQVAPERLAAVARQHACGNYRLCWIRGMNEDDKPARASFKALGCRLTGTEPFMVHLLDTIAAPPEPFRVVRVTNEQQAEALFRTAMRRQILPEHLTADPPPMREYMALDGERPVGWVGSVIVGEYTWCTNMFVAPSHRRRGIARSLLTRMLTDDRAAGVRANLLLASHTGAKLYHAVGYTQIGELLAYTPKRQ